MPKIIVPIVVTGIIITLIRIRIYKFGQREILTKCPQLKRIVKIFTQFTRGCLYINSNIFRIHRFIPFIDVRFSNQIVHARQQTISIISPCFLHINRTTQEDARRIEQENSTTISDTGFCTGSNLHRLRHC